MTYIPAAHHGPNTNAPVSRIVIHSTCPGVGFPAASKAGRAVSTANYFASTSRPASAHYVVDIATTVQCLPENTVGYHAPPNSGSIGIEICSDGGSKGSFENPAHAYTTTQWLSPEVWPAVERAAHLTRDICRRHHIPVRKLNAEQLRDGMSGICGHADVSAEFHQSDHDDPGDQFPWRQFMDLVQGHTPELSEGELSMSDIKKLTELITATQRQLHYDIGVVQTQSGNLRRQLDALSTVKNPVTGKPWKTKDALWSVWFYVLECRNRIQRLESRLSAIEKKVK